MRPDPPDLPAGLDAVEALDGDGLRDAVLADAELRGCRLDGIRGATALRGIAMRWDDVLANAAVFAAACGIRVLDD